MKRTFVLVTLVILLIGVTIAKESKKHAIKKRSFEGDDFSFGNKKANSEAEIMNMHLSKDKYKNSTYREEYCKSKNWSIEYGCNISGLLDSMLRDYDKRLRPLMERQKPVVITVGFWILSIDKVNVVDMDYQIDFFFRQAWVDPRLNHSFSGMLTVSNTVLQRIWQPDTYFENSKRSTFHDVTVPNKMLRIHQDGKVEYNARISVRASCPMDLRMFPMDKQKCALNIESYGYSDSDIVFKWENKTSRIAIGEKVRSLPQYNLTDFQTEERYTQYIVGNWSGLSAIFVLERRTGYFFIHLYSPCALIVMISWISFCIPKESTAARVALGITSVLTITTILNMLNTSMPKVSYIKAVDWYLIVSFIFVFAVLMEYTLVLWLTDKERQQHQKLKRARKKDSVENENVNPKDSIRKRTSGSTEYHELRARVPNIIGKHFEFSHDDNHTKNGKPVVVIFDGHKYASKTSEQVDEPKGVVSIGLGKTAWKFKVDTIDEYSRLIFPTAFATFNIVYWVMFLAKKKDE